MYVAASPDIIQLDKWSVRRRESRLSVSLHTQGRNDILLSVAGGVNKNNVADYAKLGIRLFITSAPYYAATRGYKGGN